MTVADDVTLDDLILAKDDLSGADIKVRVRVAIHSFTLIFSMITGAESKIFRSVFTKHIVFNIRKDLTTKHDPL